MPSPAVTLLGGRVAGSCTPRRGAAAAGPIPVSTMRRLPRRRSALSQGHLPAHRRPAVSIRVHQCGGPPTHHAPARRADLGARPPPRSPWASRRPSPACCFTQRSQRRPSNAPKPCPPPGKTDPLTGRSTSVLQPHLLFAAVVVCAPGTGLMASTPPGPGQHEAWPDRSGPYQRDEQPVDLGHRQGHQAEPAVQAAVSPFARSGLVALARVTARNAWASRARVMWRYQPGHLRTS